MTHADKTSIVAQQYHMPLSLTLKLLPCMADKSSMEYTYIASAIKRYQV